MCFCSTTKKDQPLFKEVIYSRYQNKHMIHSVLDILIIKASDCFSPQPRCLKIISLLSYN